MKQNKTKPRLHVVTMASNLSTPNLQYLRLSTEIAGANLRVLTGNIEEKFSYKHKIHAYYKYLSNSSDLQPDDIVLLIDAYDVIIYPSILSVIQRLDDNYKNKIIFCAEYGIYPEMIGPALYAYSEKDSRSLPRFLNSGCIISRVQDLRFMMNYANEFAEIIDDDQQILIRFALEYPDLIYIDRKQEFFFTGYRSIVRGSIIDISPLFEVSIQETGYPRQNQTGLIIASHFNNMMSYSNAYYQHISNYMNIIQSFYSNEDGLLLQEAMRCYHRGDKEAARKYLNHPIVRAHRMSRREGEDITKILESKLNS